MYVNNCKDKFMYIYMYMYMYLDIQQATPIEYKFRMEYGTPVDTAINRANPENWAMN